VIEELQREFRGQFLEVAESRLARAVDIVRHAAGAPQLRAEMHALAGEAAMLGFDDLAATARRAEDAATAWGDGGGVATCAELVAEVGAALARLESAPADE